MEHATFCHPRHVSSPHGQNVLTGLLAAQCVRACVLNKLLNLKFYCYLYLISCDCSISYVLFLHKTTTKSERERERERERETNHGTMNTTMKHLVFRFHKKKLVFAKRSAAGRYKWSLPKGRRLDAKWSLPKGRRQDVKWSLPKGRRQNVKWPLQKGR